MARNIAQFCCLCIIALLTATISVQAQQRDYTPAILVNGVPVMESDIRKRVMLVEILEGRPLNEGERTQLASRLVEVIVDETLQNQLIKTDKIQIGTQALFDHKKTVLQKIGLTEEELLQKLKQNGIHDYVWQDMLKHQALWNEWIMMRVAPFIKINHQEIERMLAGHLNNNHLTNSQETISLASQHPKLARQARERIFQKKLSMEVYRRMQLVRSRAIIEVNKM